jgi:hypothetical protein
MNGDEQTLEELAAQIRDEVEQLNARLRDAAGQRHLYVKLEVNYTKLIDSKETVATVQVSGYYQRVEPTPRPVPPLPQKRQRKDS